MPLCASKFINYLVGEHQCHIANKDKEWMRAIHFVKGDREAFFFRSLKSDEIEAATVWTVCNCLDVPLPNFADLECDEIQPEKAKTTKPRHGRR